MDTEKTLAWLAEVSKEAFDKARQGDTSLANRLGKMPSTQYYFTNVHCLARLAPTEFARTRPQDIAEADRLRVEYETPAKVAEVDTRMGKIEAELVSLKDMLKTEIAAAVREAMQPPPVKRGRKPAAPPVETEDDEAETDDSTEEA